MGLPPITEHANTMRAYKLYMPMAGSQTKPLLLTELQHPKLTAQKNDDAFPSNIKGAHSLHRRC